MCHPPGFAGDTDSNRWLTYATGKGMSASGLNHSENNGKI